MDRKERSGGAEYATLRPLRNHCVLCDPFIYKIDLSRFG